MCTYTWNTTIDIKYDSESMVKKFADTWVPNMSDYYS